MACSSHGHPETSQSRLHYSVLPACLPPLPAPLPLRNRFGIKPDFSSPPSAAQYQSTIDACKLKLGAKAGPANVALKLAD